MASISEVDLLMGSYNTPYVINGHSSEVLLFSRLPLIKFWLYKCCKLLTVNTLNDVLYIYVSQCSDVTDKAVCYHRYQQILHRNLMYLAGLVDPNLQAVLQVENYIIQYSSNCILEVWGFQPKYIIQKPALHFLFKYWLSVAKPKNVVRPTLNPSYKLWNFLNFLPTD